MAKPRSEPLLLLILTVVIGGFWFWRQAPRPASINLIAEPSPSPEVVVTGGSANGKIQLTLSQKPGTQTTNWALTVNREGITIPTQWFTTLPNDTSLSIPFNAVSPDNQYLFLKQTTSAGDRYLVLTTSGQPMGERSQALEFSALFTAKYPDLVITDVTGWGGNNLIVINTDKVGGGTGPSFWFEIPTRAFIRLSNRFN